MSLLLAGPKIRLTIHPQGPLVLLAGLPAFMLEASGESAGSAENFECIRQNGLPAFLLEASGVCAGKPLPAISGPAEPRPLLRDPPAQFHRRRMTLQSIMC